MSDGRRDFGPHGKSWDPPLVGDGRGNPLSCGDFPAGISIHNWRGFDDRWAVTCNGEELAIFWKKEHADLFAEALGGLAEKSSA